jgi:hypothetical protein
MANTIITKRKSTTGDPVPGDLEQGELAVNTFDEKLFSKNTSNAIFEIGGTGLSASAAENITGLWELDGDHTATDFGTGGKVKDGTDVLRPIGFNVMPVYEIDAADDFDLAHNGMLWHKDSGAAVSFTCEEDATIPQGAAWVVHNDDTEDLTIAQGSGVTITFVTANGPANGNVTVEEGGIVTVYKYTDTEYWVWGDKAVIPAVSALDDLSDVTLTSPADGAVMIYDTGTTQWRDYTMSNHASMTDAGVVTVSIPAAQLTDVNASASELNKMDISAHSVSVGWVLSADSASVATWKASAAATELDGLSDVNITSVNDDNFLIYDSGTGMWRNYDISGDVVINDVGVSTAQVSIITGKSAAGELVGGDDFLVSDAGVLSQTPLSAIQTYMQNNLTFGGGSVTSVTAGNGMVFTDIETTGAVTMGTPGQLTGATTNAVTGTSHTHAITTTGTGDIVAAGSPTFTGTVLAPLLNVNTLGNINGNYLVINVGESASYATGQTGEILYCNAEGGLQVNSSPDNWSSVWAGRDTATICAAGGASTFPGNVTVTGTVAGTTITGANVTTGANPGHTHTGSSISGLAAGDITSGTFSNTFLASVNGTVTNGTHSGTNTGDNSANSNYSGLVTDSGEPATLRSGGTPTLNTGVTAAEMRSLIGAGTSSTTGTVTNVNDGNGMTFTAISSTGDVTMGTPGSITDTSTNAVQTNSHTHAVSHTGTGSFAMAGSPTFTTKINTPYMDATVVGPITDPGTNAAYFGGYGVMGSRANFYVSNVGGAVALNHTGVHNANIKLVTTTTGISVTGNIVVTGNVDGKDVSTLTSNTGTVTNVNDGNGMTFTAISSTGDVTMGTPGTITDTSTNSVSTNSHTHAVSHTGTGSFAMAAGPTFTGTVAVSTLTASGNINANGNIVGDGATTITAIEQIVVDATADIRKTSHGCYLYHQSASYDNDQNGGITFSTSAASGGTTGDIWFRYV